MYEGFTGGVAYNYKEYIGTLIRFMDSRANTVIEAEGWCNRF